MSNEEYEIVKLCGKDYVRIPCAGSCGGKVRVPWADRVKDVLCDDCSNGTIDHGDMGYGTNGGRMVNRRKGEA